LVPRRLIIGSKLNASRFPHVLGQGIIGPFRRLNNSAHNEPHVFAINLSDLSSSDQSIKLLSFHSGDSFVFLDLPLARIVDQSAYPASIRRIAERSSA